MTSALRSSLLPVVRAGAARPRRAPRARERPAACDCAAPPDRRRSTRCPRARAMTAGSTPKSCSMRASSGGLLLGALACRSMMRHSDTRRLRYCQSCSLNSGWLRICSNTLVSGLHRSHDAVVRRSRNSARERAAAERRDPLGERRTRAFRPRGAGQRQRGRSAEAGGQQATTRAGRCPRHDRPARIRSACQRTMPAPGSARALVYLIQPPARSRQASQAPQP